ncbi:TetR/AcrR family transcriptional regulator [Fibrella sp. HMF5335]|uniref:TetR/AcrR family transcriptional regulator n=1 Tax=Fibrella rubiginis TaxID=2817060 RepID=A0A939GK70_9BACT|nr:TetR/AcrR family transcriptional regulator [Fibrella rubiginis]MBO0939343.1 TetR/AcrR family transcriptional regulator [Fibrella rubiginis]
MTSSKPLDRRIQRTRKLLLDSLIELVLEKGYEAVAVQDIIDRANVGRSTFYAHFENKEQLLFSGHGWLTESLFGNRNEPSADLTLGINLGILFQHAADNHRLAKAMLGKKGGELIINHLHELVYTSINQTLQANQSNQDTSAKRLVSQAIASMLVGLLRSWLEADLPLSPGKASTLARALLLGSLAELPTVLAPPSVPY